MDCLSFEAKTKQENNCSCFANNMAVKMNAISLPFASKNPVCPFESICNQLFDYCPYHLTLDAIKSMASEITSQLIAFYDQFFISPQNVCNIEMTEEQKLEHMTRVFDEYRPFFRREEERILYTEEFRRLQYKTQVMINSASDDQRTRLLHSLEVQKISRKISMALQANSDLSETIALAHDIGHAPFGHAGEYAIRDYLEDNLAGSFSHALQSVKILDFICSHRALKPSGFKGLGISDYVLEGVLKHDTDTFTDDLSSAAFCLQYECPSLYVPVGLSKEIKDKMCNKKRIYIGGIETQIVCWADKIAYMSHDWEEFVAVDLLGVMLSRINVMIIQLDDFINNLTDGTTKFNYISEIERDTLQSIDAFYKSLKDHFYSSEFVQEFSDDNQFIAELVKLIKVLEKAIDHQDSHPTSFLFYSKEQYQTMCSFFRVAWAWMVITKVLPEKISGKMDLIFVISKYLRDTTSHRTVPALIDVLVESWKTSCLDEHLNQDRTAMIQCCNKKLNEVFPDRILTKCKKRQVKKEIKQSFALQFSSKYKAPTEIIGDFIYKEYIESTRIRFMTMKAGKIVKELMSFYNQNPTMLPLKYRKRIEFETDRRAYRDRIQELLIEYYMDRVDAAIAEDKETKNTKQWKRFCTLIKRKAEQFDVAAPENLFNCDPDVAKTKLQAFVQSSSAFTTDAIKLRVIADYVAGMTDRMAEKKYNEVVSSGTQWSKEFSEMGTFNI